MRAISKPIYRSKLRSYLGMKYYSFRRKLLWMKSKDIFASDKTESLLPHSVFSHKTILRRKLKDVDMWVQENKIVNVTYSHHLR